MIKKKALCIASMASNLDNFNRNNVEILQGLGYEVTLASNFNSSEDTNSQEKIDSFVSDMRDKHVNLIQIDFTRRIGNIKAQFKSCRQVKHVLKQNYDIIHCHSPICSAITRTFAIKYRKKNTKVLYTAHGFHFYDGAPLKNWLLYYPVEKFLSRYTDVLITINNEDYKRAKTKFKAQNTIYIPGVGVDTKKFAEISINTKSKRMSLGIKDEDYVVISVGELNENKNHQVILHAISRIRNDNIKYLLVGKGELEYDLKKIAEELDIAENVIFTGYRTDVDELLNISNVFAFPSKREGLGLAAIEGMSSGLPVIGHDIGGIRDFVIDGQTGWLCKSNKADEYKELLEKTINQVWDKNRIREIARKFDKNITNEIMKQVYEKLL